MAERMAWLEHRLGTYFVLSCVDSRYMRFGNFDMNINGGPRNNLCLNDFCWPILKVKSMKCGTKPLKLSERKKTTKTSINLELWHKN